jgi:hypothetical protein
MNSYEASGVAGQEQKRQRHTMQQTAATLKENEQDLTRIPIEYALHLQRRMHLSDQKQGVPRFCCHPV